MRVALIASSLRLAGAEKQFVYTARALRDAGMDARVFYLGAGGHYRRVLEEAGIPLRQIYKPGRPFAMLGCLVKELRRFKPHVVLASQFGDLIFAGLAGRFSRALVLGGVRSDGHYEFRTSGRRSWLMLRLAHGLIANSHRAKQNLISRGVGARKIVVLPNVIDLAEFDSRANAPLINPVPVGRLQVTAVGILHECKRFDRFLDGLALARLSYSDLLGVLAGKNAGARPALEHRAVKLGLLPGHIQFRGECENVPALLRQSRILVLCSAYEGFPNVILEGMAARLPVITTPVGDAVRIVRNGVTGCVVEPDNTSQLAGAFVHLSRDSHLSARMGDAGRDLVEREYAFSALANRLLSVILAFARQHGKNSVVKLLERMAVDEGADRGGSLPASSLAMS